MQEIPCEHRFMLNWHRETVKIKYFDYIHEKSTLLTTTYYTQGSSKRFSYTISLGSNCTPKSFSKN